MSRNRRLQKNRLRCTYSSIRRIWDTWNYTFRKWVTMPMKANPVATAAYSLGALPSRSASDSK